MQIDFIHAIGRRCVLFEVSKALNWELVHRLSAVLVGAFIVSHLGVHLMAVVSPEAHGAGLAYMRQFYYDPLYEAILIIAILIQIVSGYAELKLIGKSGWRLVRNVSGLYLMWFLLIHVGTVLYARHIDFMPTNFYWVAGSLAYDPLKYAVMTFYALGVFSFFAHMIAVWRLTWKRMPGIVLEFSWGIAILTTTLIILAFAGLLYQLEIPASVSEYYEGIFAPLFAQPSSTIETP